MTNDDREAILSGLYALVARAEASRDATDAPIPVEAAARQLVPSGILKETELARQLAEARMMRKSPIANQPGPPRTVRLTGP